MKKMQKNTVFEHFLPCKLLAQGITDVVKRDLATEEVRAETVKELRGLEREEADHLVACLKLYEGRIQVVRGQMATPHSPPDPNTCQSSGSFA